MSKVLPVFGVDSSWMIDEGCAGEKRKRKRNFLLIYPKQIRWIYVEICIATNQCCDNSFEFSNLQSSFVTISLIKFFLFNYSVS